jgi:DtxR family Mn-dependent transcriptional regulator
MQISENGQELLEKLWIALEEKGQPGLEASAAAPVDFKELQYLGLIHNGNGAWKLTPRGSLEASRAIRRHRLGERLVADILRSEEHQMEEQACRLEHALIDGLDESICTLLGHPAFCPHGNPIPQGECCRQQRKTVDRLIAPLSECKPGQAGQIAYLRMNHPARLGKLMSMGILPGGQITLIRHSPSIVFDSGYSQFAIDEEIAADIFVRLRGD